MTHTDRIKKTYKPSTIGRMLEHYIKTETEINESKILTWYFENEERINPGKTCDILLRHIDREQIMEKHKNRIMNTFTFRSECLDDYVGFCKEWSHRLRNTSFDKIKLNFELTSDNDLEFATSDVDISIETDATYEEIKSIMGSVVDGHIMERTLELKNIAK